MALRKRIQIYGLPQAGDDESAPLIRLLYEGRRATVALPSCLIATSPDFLLPDLGWSLEDFATKDPFNANKAKEMTQGVTLYTGRLVQLIFEALEETDDLLGCDLTVELSDRWIGSSLPVDAGNGANVVSLVHWECLEDVEGWLSSSRPASVTVIRRTSCRALQSRVEPSKPMSATPTRILALTARPYGDSDIPHRLITRTMYDVVESLKGQVNPPELHIARPGSVKGLESVLSAHPAGYFDIVHLDVHGVADETGASLLLLQDDETTMVEHLQALKLAEILHRFDVHTVIMNACRSAASINNFARALVQEGISTVLGMQYKLLETAAEVFATAFYRELLGNQRSVSDACSFARSKLRQDPHRRTNYNSVVSVPDWMNPVIFLADDLIEAKKSELAHLRRSSTWFAQSRTITPTNRLLGREGDILGLENDFMTVSNVAFLSGSLGVGKTALAHHLSWWWQATGLTAGTISMDFATSASRDWPQVIQSFCDQIGDPAVKDEKSLLQHVLGHRHLVLFDSVDELDPENARPLITAVAKFVKAIKKGARKSKNASMVLLIGRNEKDALKSASAAPLFPLHGMNVPSSLRVAYNIITGRSNVVDATDSTNAHYMEEIVTLLRGNALALEIVMTDLANRTDKPREYYERLTSNAFIDINEKFESSRAVQHARRVIDSAPDATTFSRMLPQKPLMYLSPFWNVIPAKLAPYWKFLELACTRAKGVGASDSLHDAVRNVVEAVSPSEERLFMKEVGSDVLEPSELDALSAGFSAFMSQVISSGFVDGRSSLQLGTSFDTNKSYYTMHPILTICLRNTLHATSTAELDHSLMKVALTRFYQRRSIISWEDYGQIIPNNEATIGIRKQMAFEFDNYMTAYNSAFSTGLTRANEGTITSCTFDIHHLAFRNARAPVTVLWLRDRGIEYLLKCLQRMEAESLHTYGETIRLWLREGSLRLTGRLGTAGNILASDFGLLGVVVSDFTNVTMISAYELDMDLSKYRAIVTELKRLAQLDRWATEFQAFARALEASLVLWDRSPDSSYSPKMEASRLAMEQMGQTLMKVIPQSEAEQLRKKLAKIHEEAMPSLSLRDKRRELFEDFTSKPFLDLISNIAEFDSHATLPEIEEKAQKLLQAALQDNQRAQPIVQWHYVLAILAFLRWDLDRAEEHVKLGRTYLVRLPEHVEPRVSHAAVLDQVEKGIALSKQYAELKEEEERQMASVKWIKQ